MSEIGSSHIAWTDFIICGVAFVLLYALAKLNPDTVWSRVVTILTGCAILAIIVTIIMVDLTSSGVNELGSIGFFLAFGLLRWNDDRRTKLRPASVSPAETAK